MWVITTKEYFLQIKKQLAQYTSNPRPYIHKKITDLFTYINIKFKKIGNKEFDKFLFEYIKNAKLEVLNEVSICITKNYTDKKLILFVELDNEDNSSILMGLFIYKAIHKSSIFSGLKLINYLTNDEILNNIIEIYKNFYIYYMRREISNNRSLELRGELIKLLNLLVMNKILVSKKSFYKNKTTEYMSFQFENVIPSDIEYLKLSVTPFKLILINENYYLVGDFFIMIRKVFIENILSNYYFKMHNITHLEKLLNNEIYINVEDLSNVIQIINESGINLKNAYKTISDKNTRILTNLEKIKNSSKYLKNDINSRIPNIFFDESFIKIKNQVINFFLIFLSNKADFRYDCFNDENKNYLIDQIYLEFIKIFNNAFLKMEFKNVNELLMWKESLLEFGYACDADNFKGEDSKIYLNEKIDPHKISFLTYLMLLDKEEILNAVQKVKDKPMLEKINIVKIAEIEHSEDTYLDKKKILRLSFIKFNINQEINLNFTQKIKDIEEIKKENCILKSEISKLAHLYNLIILYNYCQKDLIKLADDNKNIRVYFMVFFDFRGRCYYDSIISPTNNKFSRLIFNYGLIRAEDINYTANEFSLIISKYHKYIEKCKIMLKIDNNKTFVNDSVFWCLIAIGKITIKKNNKVMIWEFLENALKTIETPVITDIFDRAEYSHILKILHSLNNSIIIRRGIVKDATASFFQNLIRILGPKTKEIKEMANLDSIDTWFDWYSHMLSKWIINEKLHNLYSEHTHKYFTRKTTKRTNMTLAYEASFITLLDYFEEDVIENFKIVLNNDLKEIFKRFYWFVRNNFKSGINFIKSPNNLDSDFKEILRKDEEIVIFSSNKDECNLTYYKTITKHFDFIIKVEGNRKRIIKNYKILTKIKDTRKTTTAVKANLVHFVDAILVREINDKIYKENNVMYMSIHDSFIVDFINISNFIIITNDSANQNPFKSETINENDKFFSIFIFL